MLPQRGAYTFGPKMEVGGGLPHLVPHGPVSPQPPLVHAGEHGNVEVGVVVDEDFGFTFTQAVQAAGILGQGSPPGDRQRQEQGS